MTPPKITSKQETALERSVRLLLREQSRPAKVALTRTVWVCEICGMGHLANKPDACESCGSSSALAQHLDQRQEIGYRW